LHLPQLIDAIHEVHSPLIGPYLDRNQRQICQTCVLHHSSTCPCPMESLAVLLVEAVETVDRRRERRESTEPDLADMDLVSEKGGGHRLLAGSLRQGSEARTAARRSPAGISVSPPERSQAASPASSLHGGCSYDSLPESVLLPSHAVAG